MCVKVNINDYKLIRMDTNSHTTPLSMEEELHIMNNIMGIEDFNELSFKNLPENIRYNKNILLKAIEKDYLSLQYTSNELKNDPKIILMAISQNHRAFYFASIELRNNRHFILEASKHNRWLLLVIDKQFQNDYEIFLECINNNGDLYDYVSQQYNSNLPNFISRKFIREPEVILSCIQNSNTAIWHIPDELKNDRCFMAMAISKNYKALCVASDKLTSDRSFILEIVKKNAMIMLIIKSEVRFKYSLLYKNDEEICLLAVVNRPWILSYCSCDLQNNFNFIVKAISQNKDVLRCVSVRMFNKFIFAQKITFLIIQDSVKHSKSKLLYNIPKDIIRENIFTYLA
jgi:hypothetical protein